MDALAKAFRFGDIYRRGEEAEQLLNEGIVPPGIRDNMNFKALGLVCDENRHVTLPEGWKWSVEKGIAELHNERGELVFESAAFIGLKYI